MVHFSIEAIQYILMPIIAAQLLLMVLVYFSLVSKKILVGFHFHATCLLCYAFFLIGRIAQNHTPYETAVYILYVRISVLFSLGVPSMMIATALQVGADVKLWVRITPFVLGILASIFYITTLDLTLYFPFTPKWVLSLYPTQPSVRIAESMMYLYIGMVVLLPCGYLIIRQLRGQSHPTSFYFLAGTLSFGVSQLIGGLVGKDFLIHYTGYIISALCWSWAVFTDIQETKSRADALKDELQLLMKLGKLASREDVEELLGQLEQSSQGNIGIYKLKVREILNRLTDTTIQAGGDAENLLARNAEKIEAIKKSATNKAIRNIVTDEALELSDIIVKLPSKRNTELIQRTESLIDEGFTAEFDIGKIAQQLNVSDSYLMRTYKKLTGRTINQQVTHKRIERAKALLIDHSVTDTAFCVGYNSSNYFSTVFKKETGQSPVTYQKSLES